MVRIDRLQQGVAAGAVLESAGKAGLKWAPEVGWAGLAGAVIVVATMEEPSKQEWLRIRQEWQQFATDARFESAGKTGLRWAGQRQKSRCGSARISALGLDLVREGWEIWAPVCS